MKKMVVGFAFSEDLIWVLLVNKTHPDWQRGFWNGVGGKMEADEDRYQHEAMVREFQEETGIQTNKIDWECTVVMHVLETDAIIYFFRTTLPIKKLTSVATKKNDVGEQLGLLSAGLPISTWMPNLRWLIPLQNQPLLFPIQVVEKKKGGFG